MSHLTKCLFVILLLGHAPAWALESDRQQPINIKADHIVVNEKQGFSLYQGNVLMTQGSLRVTGDKITVYLKQNRLQRIIATGNPATLQQKPEKNQELITSRAMRMEYDVKLSRLVLKQDALVEQGPNRFSGNHIVYNILTSTVTADKDPNHQAKDPDAGRVSVTITPPKDEEDADTTPAVKATP